jgi:hypothetical protein
MLGPFYEPGAPVRTSVGSGYELSGAVLAAEACKPIPNARIEFWLANPRGEYDDAHRATVFAGESGEYRLESNVPVSYGGRPPHIHVRVRSPGYEELVTQHYPERGQRKANFDLVLVAQWGRCNRLLRSAAITEFRDREILWPRHLVENTPEKSPNSSPGPPPHVPRLFKASSNVSVAEGRGLEDAAGLTMYRGLYIAL